MHLKIKILTLFLFTFLFGLLSPKFALASTFSLSGSVQNSSGTAVGGAAVDIYSPGTTTDVVPPTTTDSQTGNYNFSSVPQGTYDIKVTPPSGSNFSPAIALSQNISTNTILNFILTPSGTVTLSGHILDAQGNPLLNQTVQLNPSRGGSGIIGKTDSTGSYSIQVSSGTYGVLLTGNNNSLSAAVPVSYSYSGNISLTQSINADIILPANSVQIHVQDASGKPVGGILIHVPSTIAYSLTLPVFGSGSVGEFFDGPTTDNNGNATIWLFPTTGNETYTINAVPPSGSSYSPTSLQNVTVTANNTPVTITLNQPVILSGHIFDAQNNPLPNQTIQLNPSAGGSGIIGTTDSTGSYSIQASVGRYGVILTGNNNSLSATVPQNYSYTGNISLTQNTSFDITLPANSVQVHVQDASGNPVSGIILNVPSTTSYSLTLSVFGSGAVSDFYNNGPTTDSNGNTTIWLFPTVSNETYTINAVPPSGSNFSLTSLQNVTVTANNTQKTIVLTQPVILSGHILDALGSPLPNQTIQLNPSGGGPGIRGTTDSTGSYSIQASTGAYGVTLTGNGNSLSGAVPRNYSYTGNISLTQNINADITLPANSLQIHIQDALNNPVGGVLISVPSANSYTLTLPVFGLGTVINYGDGPTTDNNGNATIWLFPTTGNETYTINAIPPSGSIYARFSFNNVTVTGNQIELISLQFNHATPTTTATLSPSPDNQGNYPDPTTVTLSVTAANGYTVANTYYIIDGGSQQTYSSPFTVTGSGNHTITYWSVDNSGVTESVNTKTFTIHVNQPPSINPISNATINEGDTYSSTGSFTDTDSTSWTGTVDYGDGLGSQSLSIDQTNKTFSLSHVYKDEGTYTVTVKITDNQGATGTGAATITVNNTPFIIGAISSSNSVVQVNNQITASASFNDPGVKDTHTASWNWGDGSAMQNGTLTESNGSGNVSDTHAYTAAGVYTITLTVTDDDGVSNSQQFQYESVYNPTSQGLFSAGQHFSSPAGAYPQNSTLTGTVKFGLSYKYQGTMPVGDKQFTMNFNAANLSFNATSISSLVIANGMGTVTGTGTINGSGNYNFLVTGSESANTIRIQITDSSNNVIYDTQPGAAATATPTTSVTGHVLAH